MPNNTSRSSHGSDPLADHHQNSQPELDGGELDEQRSTGREFDYSAGAILGLAIPALGSLVIEPLMILIDSIMVGHLGVAELGGLGLAGTVLNTLVGVFVFLAYSTTASSAQMLGAGRRADGIRIGAQALWLAFALGLALTLVLEVWAPGIVALFGPGETVHAAAVTYLRAAAPGMIGMLVILAANGVLRGLLDTRTPLLVLGAGTLLNVALNALLIYGLGLGILGAGLGLTIAQTAMAAAMVYVVARAARSSHVSLRPSLGGVGASAKDGFPLFVRTLSLRAAILAFVAVATRSGDLTLAGNQVVNSLWTMAAFALDALAIAAQGLVGVATGSGDTSALRGLIRRLSWWGVAAGIAIGAVLALAAPWLPRLFGSDQQMWQVATPGIVTAAVLLPLAGFVFVLDGVLIGAGQGRYLAVAGVVTTGLYLPLLWAIDNWVRAGAPLDVPAQALALVWLWLAFGGYLMLGRAIANANRAFRPDRLVRQ